MLPKSCSSDDIVNKSETNSLRKSHSTASTELFDYLDNGISRSHSQFSGILSIASQSADKSPSCSPVSIPISATFDSPSSNDGGLRGKLVGFLKKHIKIIPVMLKSSDEEKENNNNNQEKPKKHEGEEGEEEEDVEIQKQKKEDSGEEKKKKMMDSESDVYEIDELNSTIAPSSSRQCIVGSDLECAPPAPKKPKKKAQQRTDFHPKPPFSCWPIYTAILLGLLVVLIVGAVTTIIDMRPEFLYGGTDNSTNITSPVVVFDEPPVSFSTLKPQ